ncbi:MAG: hypothetical protein ACREFD_15855, partial [Stellaceae bacterium]
MGLPRRTVAYAQAAYVPLEIVAFVGAMLLVVALGALLWQLWVSIRDRDENRVFAGDPWDGRSLEWSNSAPAPEYNFAVIPVVTGRDAFTMAKEEGTAFKPPLAYTDIELPKNCALGPAVAAIGFSLAFGLVWHIWWLVILSFAAAVASMIIRGFARNTTRIISADEVKKEHQRWLDAVARAPAVSRAVETRPANMGLAQHEASGVSP